MNKFERCEKKYLLTKATYEELLQDLLLYIKEDVYHKYTIYNIYMDSDHFDLISRSLEKPAYKEKVRIRRYDDGDEFIELKKKYEGVVYKRRTTFPFQKDSQIQDEIQYVIDYYHLKPALFLAYDRKAYVSKDDPNLRITFDTNLRYRFHDLSLEDHPDNEYYFKDEFCIMEVKIPGGMPLWLTHLFDELHIYPTSFSKYGKIYQKEKERLCYV